MKFVLTGLLAATAVMVAGCESQPKPSPQATTPSVLDVSASPARVEYQTPVYTTPAYASATPTTYAGPAYLPPYAGPAYVPPAVEPTPAYTQQAPGRSTYVVQQGDTLFHIAKVRYGDGRRWQQIASANPGVTPTTLRVGQSLVVP